MTYKRNIDEIFHKKKSQQFYNLRETGGGGIVRKTYYLIPKKVGSPWHQDLKTI